MRRGEARDRSAEEESFLADKAETATAEAKGGVNGERRGEREW